MRFQPTGITGAWVVELQTREDARGFFARSFCAREFADHGLTSDFPQCNISYNEKRGTLRGLHFQADPHPEIKLVRCTRGVVFDVVVDLRPTSATFRQWFAAELSIDNHKALYIPAGCAHGFQTLTDQAELFYQMGEFYYPELARGVRWNDSAFSIKWPVENPIISEQDSKYPDFKS